MARTWPARLVVLLAAVFQLLVARPAHAWVELHVARDDVSLSVAADGSAEVEHRVLLLVSGGPLKSLRIRAIDRDAALIEGAFVAPEKSLAAASAKDAAAIPADAVPLALKKIDGDDAGTMDLDATIDGGAGVSRGRYVAVFRYRTDLRASGGLVPGGASATIAWTGPRWDDGLDTVHTTFRVPRGKTEPRAQDDDSDGGTYLASLTRRSGEDVLELVRPYVSRGERVRWTIALDARVFAGAAPAPAPAPPPADPRSAEVGGPGRARGSILLWGGVLLFALVSALSAAQAIERARKARERGQSLRPLTRLPLAVRSPLAGIVFVAGVYLEIARPRSIVGVLLVASTVLLFWLSPGPRKVAPRAPGTWLFVRAEEAFRGARSASRDVFDLRGTTGKLAALALVLAFALLGWGASKTSILSGLVVGLSVAPLLALWGLGAGAIAPDLAVDSLPLLERIAGIVKKRSRGRARIAPRLRVPVGSADADEVRVAFLPERAVFGLRAIEVGVSCASGPGGHVLLPEVLVRFDEGTQCEAVVEGVGRFGKVMRGRRLDERVIAIMPKLPTARVTADLVLALLDATSVAPRPGAPVAGAPVKPARKAAVRRAASAKPSEDAARAS